MAAANRKEQRKVVAAAIAQGCTLTRSKRGGHWKLYCPNGKLIVLDDSASDHRAFRNTVARLRREGIEV